MRSQPLDDSATMQTANKTKTTPTPAKITCIKSVKVAVSPRICIGYTFQSTKPFAAFPKKSKAVDFMALFPFEDLQTPSEKPSNNMLDNVKRETTRPFVGVAIANN